MSDLPTNLSKPALYAIDLRLGHGQSDEHLAAVQLTFCAFLSPHRSLTAVAAAVDHRFACLQRQPQLINLNQSRPVRCRTTLCTLRAA